MEPNTGALPLIAEVGIGFVGFSTIVAVLRQTFGSQLSALQILLIHFYIETGLLNVALALLPIGLFSLLDSELAVWRASTLAIAVVCCVYLPTYIRRRRAVHAPNPVISWLVMVGYAVSSILLVLTQLGRSGVRIRSVGIKHLPRRSGRLAHLGRSAATPVVQQFDYGPISLQSFQIAAIQGQHRLGGHQYAVVWTPRQILTNSSEDMGAT